MQTTWAIGDIHGHAKHFEILLEMLPMQDGDRIILLGDLIDRGPDSKEVLRLVRKLCRSREVTLIRGNHETMMLQARSDRNACLSWLQNGGDATLNAYQANTLDAIPMVDWQLLESMVPYVETEDAIYLHASFDPLLEMKDQAHHDLFWRFCEDPSPHCSGKFIVCGHTLQQHGLPALWDKVICIDTLDPPENNWLTAVCLQKKAFFQVNATGGVRFETISSLEISD